MKDEQNKKDKGPAKTHDKAPDAVPAADQTPGVAGPPLDHEPQREGTSNNAAPAAVTPGKTGDSPPADTGEPVSSPADGSKSEPVVVTPPVNAAADRESVAGGKVSTAAADTSPNATERPESSGSAKASGSAGTPPRGPTSSARPASSGGGGGKALAGLALLVALAALGLSGWQWYEEQGGEEPVAEQPFEDLSTRQDTIEGRIQRLSSQVQALPEPDELQRLQRLTSDLQRSQQSLGQRLEALQGEAQADWKLAEAEYMLRLAGLRLMAAQDVRSAKELLRAADEILRDQPDSGVFPVREQLAQVLAELETLPEIDRPGLYLRLAALHEQVNRIVALPVPVFDPDEVSVEEEYEDRMARRTRAERVLMRLERYVRVDFQRGKVITPLLDEAEMQRIRRTLQLSLEQAQWAALRGQPEVYRVSLERAEGILQQFFELDNPQVRGLQNQLVLLAEQQVALETPDLGPLQRGLAAYIQSLRGGSGAEPVRGQQPAPTEASDE